jgi:glycine/D-amino acid oxidase-like deaminating enzyme
VTSRRDVIVGSGAFASVMTGMASAMPVVAPRQRVVVIGAGIIGLSAAYHLSLLGADVVVLEKERGAGRGCTQGAFAMLIADRPEGPAELSALYGLAVLDWRRLQEELAGGIDVQWGGMLHWARPGADAEALLQSGRAVRSLGGAAREIDAQDFAALAPGVRPGAMGGALFRPHYGAVNPAQAVLALADAAAARGVRLVYGCDARALRLDARGGVAAVDTDRGEFAGDTIIIAAGAGSPALAAAAGARIPIEIVSGTLVHTRPHRRVLSRVLNGPEGSIKQDCDGRIVTGLDYRPGADGTDTTAGYGERLLAAASEVVPGIRGARLDFMTLGYVPIPADFRPIVGFCAPNLYVMVTMSGITMAPLLGRLAAAEIVERAPASLLTNCRPDRFT